MQETWNWVKLIRNCYRWKDSQTLLRPNEAFTPVHNARWPWRPFQVDSHPLEKRHCGRMWLLVKLGRLQQAMSCWSTHTKPFPTKSQTTIPNNKMAVKFILICFSVSKLCVYCLAIKIYIFLRSLASFCWKLFTSIYVLIVSIVHSSMAFWTWRTKMMINERSLMFVMW